MNNQTGKVCCKYCKSSSVEKRGEPYHVDGDVYAQLYHCVNKAGCDGYEKGGVGHSFSLEVPKPVEEEEEGAPTEPAIPLLGWSSTSSA